MEFFKSKEEREKIKKRKAGKRNDWLKIKAGTRDGTRNKNDNKSIFDIGEKEEPESKSKWL